MLLKTIYTMTHISGIDFLRNTKGKPTKVVIDIKKHYNLLEDIIDMLTIEQRKDEATFPIEGLVAKLDKKHGIKR